MDRLAGNAHRMIVLYQNLSCCRYSVRSNQAQFHSPFSFGSVDHADQFEQGTHNAFEICKIRLDILVML
ncbi:hypothetical protein ACS0TY_021883 [Phlomoides rotata]